MSSLEFPILPLFPYDFSGGSSMRYTPAIRLAFIGLALTACNQQEDSVAPGADWVLTNGRIYTVDEEQPWAEAVVIKDGEFVYVGHTHPGQIDLTRYEARFEANTREAFMAQLEAYAQENRGDGWLRGCCWPTYVFVDGSKGPDRADLDPIFPDRPVWLKSGLGHSFWLNSVALETSRRHVQARRRRSPDRLGEGGRGLAAR